MSSTSVPAEPAGTGPPAAHLGERRLTTIHAIGQSLAVGPIFSAGLLTGLVAAAAGFNTPLSVLLGLIGVLGLGYVVSLYAQRYAGAGAVYEYLTRGAHPDVGVFSAGLYALGLLFLGGGGVFIALGFLTEGFFATHLDSISIDWWIWGLISLAITTGLNHFGVRIAIRGVLALAFLSAIPFVITSVAVILDGGANGNTLSVFDPSQTSMGDVFNGVLFAVTLFIGFEIAASIAEETHEPKRSIPIAVIGTIAIAGLFYLLVTYAAAIGFGEDGIEGWGSASPIGDIAAQYVGSGMATIVDLVVILDALSVAIAFTVGASRIFFALGRDGLLPRGLASTTAHHTPLGGNLVVVGAGLAAIAFAFFSNYGTEPDLPNEIQVFFISAAAGTFLITAVYVVLAIFGFKLAIQSSRDSGGLWWKLPAVVAGLAVPVLAYKGSLDPWPEYPNNRGIIFALVCLVLVAIWYGVLKLAHPDRIRGAAAYAETHGQ